MPKNPRSFLSRDDRESRKQKEEKPARPSKFFEILKKRDERKIAEVVNKGGGPVKTWSNKATDPRNETKRLRRGSVVTSTVEPGSVKMTGGKFKAVPTSKTTVSQELSTGSLQKPKAGDPTSGSKQRMILGKQADDANAAAVKENPAKKKQRDDTNAAVQAKIDKGERVPVGVVSYRTPKGKHEYAGEVKDVKKTTHSISTSMDKPQFEIRKSQKRISVTEPNKDWDKKRKNPRNRDLTNKMARHGYTKGEGRRGQRKSTESGYGPRYKKLDAVVEPGHKYSISTRQRKKK